MEVATATPSNGGVPPYHDHDVREWSTLNSLTGVLERARIETDHWAAKTNNSSHKYGKVVDSRARTDADGALRQQARRQLEVFQSQVPGGQLQVIKTHSVSSSRWTNKRVEALNGSSGEFEGLQIPSNPLDLTFQKNKAVVGRSAARRPPSRIKNKEDFSPTREHNLLNNPQLPASANLQRVTRLCHQIHENAVKQAFGKSTNRSAISERLNLTKTNEIEEIHDTNKAAPDDRGFPRKHTNLSRTKSSSSEDFLLNIQKDKSTKSIEDLEDLEQLQTWRRTSKIRRSLQHPKQDRPSPNKPIDLPETSVSVRKITEDFEKGRRLSTALRGNSIDLQALDQILQSISSSSSDKTSIAEDEIEPIKPKVSKSKRSSFVTAESLQEIKGRLRRTSSPEKDFSKNTREPETDDGIVTEENISKSVEKMIESNNIIPSQSRVRSYVYGMESVLNKKPVTGTGSLESRSKLLNGITNRSEDWYNRRKSYGFEPVQNQNESMSTKKKIVESSTDSGICRSSEVIVVPSVIKNHTDSEDYNSDSNGVRNRLSGTDSNKDSSFGNVKKISSLFDSASSKTNLFSVRRDQDLSSSVWNKRIIKENDWGINSGNTIKIPIIGNNHWNDQPEKDIKRHSIAVDETKYVSQNKSNNEARRTSLVINDKFLNAPFENGEIDFNAFNKKSKKVEFCKTEVHFAAESGKVNIVETDEKPPPTQNFRRRRRNSNSLNYLNDFNKNGLPILHFGENYIEKTLFGNGNQQYHEEGDSAEENGINSRNSVTHGVVTVNSDFNNLGLCDEDKRESENENIKGILKNKIMKPKPYHLGENPQTFNILDDDNQSWISPKPTERNPPLWKSTVTVSSTLFDNKLRSGEDSASTFRSFEPNNQPDLIKDQFKRLTQYQSDFRRTEPSDRVRPFLSVAERIRNMEESQKIDSHKGYSTRVNIGEGQAVVVENNCLNKPDVHLEPSMSEGSEMKEILKKGLVVRIGRDNSSTKHMVCSKTTTNQNSSNTTTTTKITIDLSPTEDQPSFQNAKHNGSHSFKSTSLILNTIKTRSEPEKLEKVPCQIPHQLEALKRLYEDENSDSDADKEVQLLTSRICAREKEKIEDDNSSVVSGSWSRMRAYKNVFEKANFKRTSDVSSTKSTLAQIEKDINQSKASSQSGEPVRIKAEIKNRKYSPIVLRKHPIVVKNTELKSANAQENLSSPLLVGRSKNDSNTEHIHDIIKIPEINIIPTENQFINANDSKSVQTNYEHTYVKNEKILRQPKKSELAYFGIQVPQENNNNEINKNVNDVKEAKRTTDRATGKPHFRKKQNDGKKTQSPLYENISPVTTKTKSKSPKEFDCCILDELTKAADEILQAVKDYSEEESRKQKKEEGTKTELSTVTENKSWQPQEKLSKIVDRPCKSKLKNASSNSSLEASPKDAKPTQRYISNTKASADKIKTRTTSSESSGLKATTKARRLQRASSREALLQSHGSSSEDLAGNEMPLRKPRLVRKTKTTQFTMSNGIEISKKSTVSASAKRKPETGANKTKAEERLPNALPEIRHKTAVSTIRGTAEKTIRDKSKHIEDNKKKVSQNKDGSKVSPAPVSPMKNKRETVTHRVATANIKKYRPDKH